MKRIAIIGSGGAGKSTLARALQQKLGLPLIHLDAVFWKPGWVETNRAEWLEWQQNAVKAETWIMDGNYGGSMDVRLEAADIIISWICHHCCARFVRSNAGLNIKDALDPILARVALRQWRLVFSNGFSSFVAQDVLEFLKNFPNSSIRL
jgi:ABC-type glutathione transport system ATPase component